MAITEWEIRRAALGQREIRILMCDDDPDFVEALRREVERVLAKLGMRPAIASFGEPGEIPEELLSACDMAFLDVDFDRVDSNGIDIARRLRQVNKNGLIFFVTNYIDYAPAGYEVQAFRYILKRDRDEVLERYLLQATETMAEGQVVLRLYEQESFLELPLEKIRWLEVLDHYVSIHSPEGDYTVGATLSAFEKELEAHGFLRIHKSYLVNMQYIHKFRSRECRLTDGTELAVSEKNYSRQKQKYLLWKGLK